MIKNNRKIVKALPKDKLKEYDKRTRAIKLLILLIKYSKAEDSPDKINGTRKILKIIKKL